MIEKLFEVATEFRFDVGSALINTKSLQGAVDDLSKSTDSAMRGLNFLASGLITRLGFGSGGLLTILTESVKLSQEFNSNTLNFSNTISNNMSVLTGDIQTFNDRLDVSKNILRDIQDTAIKFGLPGAQLTHMTGLIAPPLAQHGKLGTDFSQAIEMSKNLMLASEFLSINPMMAQESLFRSLQDKMPLQAKLFSRLASTETFKQAKVTTQQQLIALPYDKKFSLLDKALATVAGDADLLNLRMNQLSVQFTKLRDQIEVVLLPIGEAFSKAFVVILKGVNAYFQEHGKSLGQSIAKLFGHIFEDPKGLLVNLLQLKEFGRDFKRAAKLTELLGIFQVMRYVLVEVAGITFSGGIVRAFFGGLLSGATALAAMVPWMSAFRFVMLGLRLVVVTTLAPFLQFLLILQTLSRAVGIAKIADVVELAAIMPKLTELFVRFKVAAQRIFQPISTGMDAFARLLAPIFQTTTWIRLAIPLFELLVMGFEFLADATTDFVGVLAGLVTMVIGFIVDIVNLANPFTNALENFRQGFDDYLASNKARLGEDPNGMSSKHVYNIGSINARFDLKEQLEPDRVAFAVTEEIKRMATNPIQGSGQTLSGPFSGSKYFTGGR